MRLMDVTLRDGSYAVDFQFSASQTKLISGQLAKAQIDLIEVGHGVGIGAARTGSFSARETDVEYVKAAVEGAPNAQIGVFAIPGIAHLEDLKHVRDEGASFVRIGTEIDEARKGHSFIAQAKANGLMVCANFMKSYSQPVEKFHREANRAFEAGADYVYLVDSAGSMTPTDIERYLNDPTRNPSGKFGFHGHNNLGLANYNSLHALRLGAEIIDSSLQGLGRSAGNAVTEQLVALLQASGVDQRFDLLTILNAGSKLISPLTHNFHIDQLDVVCGLAGFHSSYLSRVQELAMEMGVDARKLILLHCSSNKRDAKESDLRNAARRLLDEFGPEHNLEVSARIYVGGEQS